MTRSLAGRVALVTGAGKGIGAGIAKAMAAAGASVVVNFASDRPGAERVVADIEAAGGKAFEIQANVSVVAEVQRLLAETVTTFGPLEILVNNASVFAFASLSSERFSAGAVAYTASKAGITGVTGVPAVELASRGIRVNQINPGAVDTEGARAIGAMSDEARAGHIARTPLGRVGTPADIASVAVFLASDEARWVTGECLAVSGGLR